MDKKVLILLALVIFLAFFLRFYKVTENPPSLNWDEVSIGYNAYSVLKTGRDEWGVFLPIHFKAYGEYKLPVQIYASIPGIALFGLNELGIRITPVIYGTLTILLVFFLARTVFENTAIGLMASFLLAISPWHIQLTRASFESSFATFWIVLGLYLLVNGFRNGKWFVWSMIPFAISVYTYNTTRVFTPLYLLALLFFYRETMYKFRKAILLSMVLFGILLLPLVPYFFSGDRNARFKLVSLTDDPGLVPRINQNRGDSNLPPPLPEFVHNKVTYISFYVIQNYLAHFGPDFLFISGAPHKQHHVQGIGELYLFQAPFILLGLFFLFKNQNKFRWLLVSWVLLAMVPVSITNDSIPHALRTLIATPFYQIITAYGLFLSYLWVKRHYPNWQLPSLISFSVVVIVSIVLYLQNFYITYPKLYSRDWQYGYRQAVDFINKQADNYDLIVFSRHYGEPHMFTLFFSGYDPARYQANQTLERFETNNWVWVLRFDKFYFPDLGDDGTRFTDIVKQKPGKRILFIGKDGDFPDDLPKLDKIRFLNGDIAFEIVESK